MVSTIPTIGFNVETVEYKKISLTVWDVGGQEKIRPLWRHYYAHTQAIIFVVDSHDPDRIDGKTDSCVHNAQEELHHLMSEEELEHTVLLVLANKQDMPQALKVEDVAKRLQLEKLIGCRWYIQGSSATTGHGLYEGLDWLTEALTSSKKLIKREAHIW